jgi:hypothetical protein
MLDQRLAEAMQRVLSSADARFSLSSTLSRLVAEGIGTKKGKSVYFTEADKAEMRSWLEAKGYSTSQCNLSNLGRADTLGYSPNEKAGGTAVKRNRVSIKAFAGHPLLVAGGSILLPKASHLDIEWTHLAEGIGHQCVLVIENYENFNRVHETCFDLPNEFSSPLVIYHGDPYESRLDNVHAFLASIQLPVLAFMDADPAGIAMASKLPGLEGVIYPSPARLEAQLQLPSSRRTDLYINQSRQYEGMLSGLAKNHPCYVAWQLIEHHRAGLVQERWICNERCELWRP